jgi:hypothetical protein
MQARVKDGRMWRIGTARDVAWITSATGLTITAAIPAVFDDYATLVLPGALGVSRDLVDDGTQDRALLALVQAQTAPQPWWLGYLDTGASDIVLWDAPKVTLYSGWSYVPAAELILCGAAPCRRLSWRAPTRVSGNNSSSAQPRRTDQDRPPPREVADLLCAARRAPAAHRDRDAATYPDVASRPVRQTARMRTGAGMLPARGSAFRDLSAASAMAVRSLGPPTTMSSVSRSVTSCGRAACRRKESPMSSSMVNFIAIIVDRSGAMSSKPC